MSAKINYEYTEDKKYKLHPLYESEILPVLAEAFEKVETSFVEPINKKVDEIINAEISVYNLNPEGTTLNDWLNKIKEENFDSCPVCAIKAFVGFKDTIGSMLPRKYHQLLVPIYAYFNEHNKIKLDDTTRYGVMKDIDGALPTLLEVIDTKVKEHLHDIVIDYLKENHKELYDNLKSKIDESEDPRASKSITDQIDMDQLASVLGVSKEDIKDVQEIEVGKESDKSKKVEDIEKTIEEETDKVGRLLKLMQRSVEAKTNPPETIEEKVEYLKQVVADDKEIEEILDTTDQAFQDSIRNDDKYRRNKLKVKLAENLIRAYELTEKDEKNKKDTDETS